MRGRSAQGLEEIAEVRKYGSKQPMDVPWTMLGCPDARTDGRTLRVVRPSVRSVRPEHRRLGLSSIRTRPSVRRPSGRPGGHERHRPSGSCAASRGGDCRGHHGVSDGVPAAGAGQPVRATIGYGRLLRRQLRHRWHLRWYLGLRKDIRRQLRYRWGLRWQLGRLRCLGWHFGDEGHLGGEVRRGLHVRLGAGPAGQAVGDGPSVAAVAAPDGHRHRDGLLSRMKDDAQQWPRVPCAADDLRARAYAASGRVCPSKPVRSSGSQTKPPFTPIRPRQCSLSRSRSHRFRAASGSTPS